MTSSARATIIGGIVKPRAFAAVRLTTNSNVAACCTGSSPGDAPFKIFAPFKDFIGVVRSLPEEVVEIRRIGDQAAGFGESAVAIDRRQPVRRHERGHR